MLSRYIIEQEEIESMRNADTLWKLIEILRPTLLTRDRRRVVAISQGVDALVYMNGSRIGYKYILQEISPLNVIHIEHIDGFSAPSRYGYDAAGGVFLVTMRYYIH